MSLVAVLNNRKTNTGLPAFVSDRTNDVNDGPKAMAASLDGAIKLHQNGRVDEAEAAYLQILAAESNHPAVLHLLGVIRQQQGRHEDALQLIGRAIESKPNAAIYHSNYGAALLSLQRFAKARDSLHRVLAIRPDYADAGQFGHSPSGLG